MRGAMSRIVLAAGFVCMTAVVSQAQQTSTSTETKRFEILSVDGNNLVVRLPEGTRELVVPDDFRFTVNGQQLSVRELKAGMRGTATVTTATTVTPVTVTEIKNGTVFEKSGGSIIVQTPEGFKMFSQGQLDKRGVKIVKNGKPVVLDDLRKGDKLTATIVTSLPPKVMTQKEVNASVATSAPAAAAPAPAPVAAAPAAAPAEAPKAKALPKTASTWPLLAAASATLLAMGFALTVRRRFAN
jgi:hypothetical protein